MPIIDCDIASEVSVKIGGEEYPLRKLVVDDQDLLTAVSEKRDTKSMKAVLCSLGIPKDKVGLIPIDLLSDIITSLTPRGGEEKK